MTRRTSDGEASKRRVFRIAAVLLALGLVGFFASKLRAPSDRTPEGAYMRVAKAVTRQRPEEFFAYLEESAQHACYTIRDFRKRALDRATKSYPAEEREALARQVGAFASAPDGADVFAIYAAREGWIDQLRADVSGIRSIALAGERATIETVRGTRYSFRRRPNGIWGMTAFTPMLVEEAERAARDADLVETAARDYERARR